MAVTARVTVGSLSDVGCVRKNNEDSFRFIREGDDFWAVVADGCGGEAAGEVASALAVETFFAEVSAGRESGRDLAFVLRDAVITANRRILEEARQTGKNGMGTTFSGIFFRKKVAFIVHVGDSRIYRLRGGDFGQMTSDHSWVAESMRAGRLTPAQAKNHPRSGMLTRALGMPDFRAPDMDILDLIPGDIFLLASDGLMACLSDNEISADLLYDPETAARRLVTLVKERGAPDNVTVIVLRVEGFNGDDDRQTQETTIIGEGPVLA